MSEHYNITCDACGHVQFFDVIIPSELWEQISELSGIRANWRTRVEVDLNGPVGHPALYEGKP